MGSTTKTLELAIGERVVLPPVVIAGIGSLVYLAVASAVFASNVEAVVYELVYHVGPLAALICGVVPLRRQRGPARIGWAAICAGIALWAFADWMNSIRLFVHGEYFATPALPDVAYYLGYVALGAGLWVLAAPGFRPRDLRVLIDAAIVFAVASLLCWEFVILPAATSGEDRFEAAVNIGYPVLDLSLVALVVAAVYTSSWRLSAPAVLLLGGLLLSAVADASYGYFSLATSTGDYPPVLDVLWVAAYCVFGMAMLAPVDEASQRESRAQALVGNGLPYIAAVLLFLAALGSSFWRQDGLFQAGVLFVFVLVLVRQHLAMRRVAELVRETEAQRDFAHALLSTQEAIGEALIIVSEGRVTFANGAATRLFGGDPVGLDLVDFVTAAERDAAAGALAALPRSEETVRFETSVRSPEAGAVAVEFCGMRMPGTPSRALLVGRDVTERRRSERALAEAQKLEGLALLAGGVAHDFNNLLTVVRGNVAVAQGMVVDDVFLAESLHDIDTAAERAAALARQLLSYTGRGAATIESVDLGRLVQEMSLLFRSAVPAGVDCRIETPASELPVRGDATELRQVVMNLVVNAAEAAGEGGLVRVACSRQFVDAGQFEPALAAESFRGGPCAVVEVHDTGPGIDPAVRARIFDPFFSTKFTGRGLGLAVVLGIVRGHGGAVRVESTPGEGTRFLVCVPLERQAGRVGMQDQAGGRGTILVVDDEDSVRTVVAMGLKRLGFGVATAADGETALLRARELAQELVLVLTDLTMQGMDGFEVSARLTEDHPGTPVVLMSGYEEGAIAQQAKEAGVAAILGKPFTLQELEASVRSLVPHAA